MIPLLKFACRSCSVKQQITKKGQNGSTRPSKGESQCDSTLFIIHICLCVLLSELLCVGQSHHLPMRVCLTCHIGADIVQIGLAVCASDLHHASSRITTILLKQADPSLCSRITREIWGNKVSTLLRDMGRNSRPLTTTERRFQ